MVTCSRTIKARVISTGAIVHVDDAPIGFGLVRFYNMWHNDTDGGVWHDDELEFLEKRLQ